MVSVTLAKLKISDASDQALDSQKDWPDIRLGKDKKPPQWWSVPDSWDPPFPVPKGDNQGVNFVSDPPLDKDGKIVCQRRPVSPKATGKVLQIEDLSGESIVPKLVAVIWPDEIAPGDSSSPTSFLIYFHANMGQNADKFYEVAGVGKYPYGFDYVHFGLWTYLNYVRDSFYGAGYCMGLPYQISAAFRNAVVVLPLNKVGKEVGFFADAESTEAALLAIQNFWFEDAGQKPPSELGRVGLAGFSASNGLVASFLGTTANQKHRFYLNTLKEIYLFDPPTDAGTWAVNQALEWSKKGANDDKMVRLYNQWHTENLGKLIGKDFPKTAAGRLDSSANGFRTSAYLPAAAWADSYKKAWAPFHYAEHPDDTEEDWEKHYAAQMKKQPLEWTDMHSWIPQMMLTDALRRSQFP
jgi:hypothetical protein